MKLFQGKKKPPGLSRAESLACIPSISPLVEWDAADNGDILVSYPFVISPLLHSIFKRFNREKMEQPIKKLQLDEMGSQVWSRINGKRSVKQLIEEFAESRGVTRHEAELAVTAFLRELGKRGLIVLG